MASSRSEENVNLKHFQHKWSHSVGESCIFMDSYILEFVLADVIANDFGQLGLFMADVIAMLPMILGNLVSFMADVIAMLPCFVVDVIPLVDVVTYFIW